MYTIIKSFHSYFAWAVLVLLVINIVMAAMAWNDKKEYGNLKIALFGMIAGHIQLLLGIILYFTSPLGMSNLSGETMKDSLGRLLAVEHPLVNIIGIALITIGYLKSKKQSAASSSYAARPVLIYFGLGLLLILSRIPWHLWL